MFGAKAGFLPRLYLHAGGKEFAEHFRVFPIDRKIGFRAKRALQHIDGLKRRFAYV